MICHSCGARPQAPHFEHHAADCERMAWIRKFLDNTKKPERSNADNFSHLIQLGIEPIGHVDPWEPDESDHDPDFNRKIHAELIEHGLLDKMRLACLSELKKTPFVFLLGSTETRPATPDDPDSEVYTGVVLRSYAKSLLGFLVKNPKGWW